MARRLALLLALVAVLSAAPLRRALETPARAPPGCVLEGRGTVPRHWLGCAADPGSPRALEGDERLALGLRLDPNVAGIRELAFVPGLSRRLAAAVVADRAERGPFHTVDDLQRVRGIGPKRLAQARAALEIAPAP
jgi:competence protein ComEA